MSLLADCFTKLMTENILPNARCVKGTTRIQLYYIISQQNEEQMLLFVMVQQTKTAVKVEIVGFTTHTLYYKIH